MDGDVSWQRFDQEAQVHACVNSARGYRADTKVLRGARHLFGLDTTSCPQFCEFSLVAQEGHTEKGKHEVMRTAGKRDIDEPSHSTDPTQGL